MDRPGRALLSVMRALPIAALMFAAASARAEPSLPAHYAKLFANGASWTYDVAITQWDYEKMGSSPPEKRPWPKKTVKRVATCKVARVATLGSARVSEVSCDRAIDPKFDRTVPGIFVARADGLHHQQSGFPTREADLEDTPLVIAAKPKDDQTKTTDSFAHATTIQGVRHDGTTWCAYANFEQLADGGKTSVCFDGGIARGGDDSGGELDDVQFRAR